MELEAIHEGTICKGQVVLDEPTCLPEGARVKVALANHGVVHEPEVKLSGPAFIRQPVFGMWADQTDLPASVDYVRELRREWDPPCVVG